MKIKVLAITANTIVMSKWSNKVKTLNYQGNKRENHDIIKKPLHYQL